MDDRRLVFPLLGAGAAAIAIFLSTGCASWHLSGYGHEQRRALRDAKVEEKGYSVNVSTRPVRRRPQDYLSKEISQEEKESLYYSDLGPDTIAVSSYPARQRVNYAVYSQACSRCHTLARSINVPVVSRGYWELYILGMRFNTNFRPGTEMSRDDIHAILDFLEYDSNVRKVQHRSEFDELTDELKRRFDLIVRERIRKLQEGDQPIILRSEHQHP